MKWEPGKFQAETPIFGQGRERKGNNMTRSAKKQPEHMLAQAARELRQAAHDIDQGNLNGPIWDAYCKLLKFNLPIWDIRLDRKIVYGGRS
jgi:hypothetical protein